LLLHVPDAKADVAPRFESAEPYGPVAGASEDTRAGTRATTARNARTRSRASTRGPSGSAPPRVAYYRPIYPRGDGNVGLLLFSGPRMPSSNVDPGVPPRAPWFEPRRSSNVCLRVHSRAPLVRTLSRFEHFDQVGSQPSSAPSHRGGRSEGPRSRERSGLLFF